MSKVLGLSAAKDGIYAASKMAGYNHPAGTKKGNSFYSDTPNGLILETVATSQNIKVEFAGSSIYVLLGKNAEGKAVYLDYKSNGNGGAGFLDVGINSDSNNPGPMNLSSLHREDDVNKKLGSGVFEFGKTKNDVYVKHSGKELFRLPQYEVFGKGSVAVFGYQGQNGIGYFKATFATTVSKDVTNKILYADKLGFVPGFSVGSAKKGSNVIEFATEKEAKKWKPGMLGFVPTGYEVAPTGKRHGIALGTNGPGGACPGDGYATQVDLEKANPEHKYSWIHADGEIRQRYVDIGEDFEEIAWEAGLFGDYRWYNKGWQPEGGYNSDFYIRYAFPKPLRFRVKSQSGKKVTIDTPLQVEVKNAPIWHDNDELYTSILGKENTTPGITLIWPKGLKYFCGDHMVVNRWQNFTQVFNDNVFASPNGAYCATLETSFCDKYKQPKGLSLEGNVNDNGTHGLRWFSKDANFPLPSVNNLSSLRGGMILSHSNNHDVEVAATDTLTSGIIVTNCKKGKRKIKYKHSTGTRLYTGWTDNTTDGTEDCISDGSSIESPTLQQGFESFGGSRNIFRNFKGVNAVCSSNTSNAILFDGNFELRYTKNCRTWQDKSAACIDLNENTGRSEHKADGGAKNGKFIFDDFVDEDGNYKRCIVVQSGYNNAVIENVECIYAKPWVDNGKAQIGHVGIASDAFNLTVLNFTCLGRNGDVTAHPSRANFQIKDGLIDGGETTCVFLKTGTIKNHKSEVAWLGPDVIIGEGNKFGKVLIWPY